MNFKNDFFSGKQILVTGAGGFLGRRLVELLSVYDCQIRRWSRQPWSGGASQRAAQIQPFQGDLSDPKSWREALSGTDVVFHLAGQTSLKFAEDYPMLDYQINVLPVRCLLETAEYAHKPLTVLFAGTATQRGFARYLPATEEQLDAPATHYDAHKWLAEYLLKNASRRGVLHGVSLRLPNIYGPGSPYREDRGILNQMLRKALQGKPLTLYASVVDCLRDYLYIDDAAEAFLQAAAYSEFLCGGHYGIGTGKGTPLRAAFEAILDAVQSQGGPQSGIQEIPDPEHLHAIERRDFYADPALFRRLTGWEAKMDLHSGLERTAEVMMREPKEVEA